MTNNYSGAYPPRNMKECLIGYAKMAGMLAAGISVGLIYCYLIRPHINPLYNKSAEETEITIPNSAELQDANKDRLQDIVLTYSKGQEEIFFGTEQGYKTRAKIQAEYRERARVYEQELEAKLKQYEAR